MDLNISILKALLHISSDYFFAEIHGHLRLTHQGHLNQSRFQAVFVGKHETVPEVALGDALTLLNACFPAVETVLNDVEIEVVAGPHDLAEMLLRIPKQNLPFICLETNGLKRILIFGDGFLAEGQTGLRGITRIITVYAKTSLGTKSHFILEDLQFPPVDHLLLSEIPAVLL